MPAKDFKSAMNKQRTATPGGQGRLGVVGDVPNPVREELERTAEQLPIKEIPIDQLHDNPFQQLARPVMDEDTLEELASSIRQNGFYGALLARRKRGTADHYELAYGHRRREAARRSGLSKLPVKVLELSDNQMARIMASENFSREDLTPLGEANVVGYLYTAQNMSVKEIEEVIGKKRGWVQPRLALYEAPQDIKQMVEQKPEAMSHVRLLNQISDETQRTHLISEILQNSLTYEQLRTQLEIIKQTPAKVTAQIDKNITIYSTTANSEKHHNVSRESNAPFIISKTDNLEPLLSREQLQRAEALKRLDNAASRFEKLAGENEYQLAEDEKSWLAEIVERLSSLLDN
jgi:ParB family chromosome partitioning protein